MKKYIPILLLFLFACTPTAKYTNSVLTISDCEMPCWNNIIPGITPAEDAKQILENIKGIGVDNVRTYDDLRLIRFSLNLETPGINRETLGLVESLNGTVLDLRLMENLNLVFNDLSQQIGMPEYVISTPFIGGGNLFVLIYPSKGVSFDIWYDEEEIRSETKITSLTLFDVSNYDYLLDNGVLSVYSAGEIKEIMYQWKGFGSIEELYPPRFP